MTTNQGDQMTETPQPVARIALTHGSTVTCLSVDLLDQGALIVDEDGDTLLYPWHRVSVIGFYDNAPQEHTDPLDAPVIPLRHEGSE
jgi:hypothetical protein